MNGQNPDYPYHNGRCCWQPSRPLYKIWGRWSSKYCSPQCTQCLTEGGDPYMFCGSGCGGCHQHSPEYLPCCPGFEEVKEGSKFVCRSSQRSCSSHPKCAHLAGNCCPTDAGVNLDCCH